MMDEPKKRSALLHRKTTPVGATGLARRIPLASVILCADPEKVVLDLLQPARGFGTLVGRLGGTKPSRLLDPRPAW